MARSMRFDRNTNEYVYEIDGEPVTQAQWHGNWHIQPPNYQKGECPKVQGDLNDFSHLNGGKGIWNPQVNGYCRNVDEVITKGRAKGYKKIG